MTHDNEQSAFPHPAVPLPLGGHIPATEGMTLRDWFAGQALAGMGTWCPNPYADGNGSPKGLQSRAEFAYAQADAMLAARKKRKEP